MHLSDFFMTYFDCLNLHDKMVYKCEGYYLTYLACSFKNSSLHEITNNVSTGQNIHYHWLWSLSYRQVPLKAECERYQIIILRKSSEKLQLT